MLAIDENISLVEGSNESMVCYAIGTSDPKINWKMDDNIFRSDILDYNLIKQLSKTDKDQLNLTCVAENQFGIDSHTVSVKLIGEMIKSYNA